MLLAAVIHLSPDRPLPASPGRAAQAWLLDTARQADPALARVLHSGQLRRPYTVGFLPHESILRITSVSDDLSRLLIDGILPELKAIRLVGIESGVTAVQTEGHNWAGRSDFEMLARDAFNDVSLPHPPTPAPQAARGSQFTPTLSTERTGASNVYQWGLEFATPTAFHQNGMDMPLPLPELVYGSLIQAWNTFSPIPLPVHMGGFIEQSVGIARHRITTRMVQFGKAEQHIGFVGKVNYIVRPTLTAEESYPYAAILNLLTQFAFYTGVGIRTTVGMGMARPVG